MDDALTYLVMFSGGLGSYFAAKRAIVAHGEKNVRLIFADTRTEDEDLYRFLREAAAKLNAELVTVCDGRDVWQVYKDARYIGNTRADPCSRHLKREPLAKWVSQHYRPDTCRIVVGIDWSESHRFERLRKRGMPYIYLAPLCDPPLYDPVQMREELERDGIELPRLYKLDAAHNNCGMFCCKAGQAQFAHMLKVLPDRYRYHERKEQELRDYLGKDVAVLRDRTGGTTKPLTLKALRERIETKQRPIEDDWGGCGCFAGT